VAFARTLLIYRLSDRERFRNGKKKCHTAHTYGIILGFRLIKIYSDAKQTV